MQRCQFTVAEQQCYAEAAPLGAADAEGFKNLGEKSEKRKEKEGVKEREKGKKEKRKEKKKEKRKVRL